MSSVIDISVITPCYNHGAFLDDAIASVKNFHHKVVVEHIIVNDGSQDHSTIEKLKSLEREDTIIIHQSNAGPANARNSAIKIAKGKYILPLDADNRIIAGVFEKAFRLMEADNKIDVLYTNAQRFGVESGLWKPGEIQAVKLLAGNYIDTCSLLRKDVLIQQGCYDDHIPVHGNEDWELWLRYFFNGRTFYWLQETGYEYRVSEQSLSKSESAPKQALINEYIVKKYAAQYADFYDHLYAEKRKLENLKSYLQDSKFKSVLKILLSKPLIKY